MGQVNVNISGYRQLSEREQALINNIKRLEEAVLATVDDVRIYLEEQKDAASMESVEAFARIDNAETLRWLSIGRTHLQEGFMAVVRSIAQPPSRVIRIESGRRRSSNDPT